MIVSHKYKFIFFKTAKTAGTSIEIALSKFCSEDDLITPIIEEDEVLRNKLGYRGPQNYDLSSASDDNNFLKEQQPIKFYNHISAREVKNWLSEEIWNQYFKFCFERNPWDRVISCYRYYISYLPPDEEIPSLSDFINSDIIGGLRKWGFDIYTINGEVVVNKVCLYENLQEDMENIRLKLDIPEKITLPQAKRQHRKNRNHYSETLNQQDQEVIAKLFETEIKLFGYKY